MVSVTDRWMDFSEQNDELSKPDDIQRLQENFSFEQQAGLALRLPKRKMFQLLLRVDFFYFHLKWDLPRTRAYIKQTQTNPHKYMGA